MENKTKQFFLQCLSDYIHGKPTQAKTDVDWARLFRIAEEQSLEGIIFYQCKAFLPREEKKQHLQRYLSHAVISISRAEVLAELINRTQLQKIPVLCIKGTVFRDYYVPPALRSMGDIDCVVKEDDRDTVDRILREEMGFQRFIDNHAVWTYWKGKVYIEVHTHMFYESLANAVDYREYFDHVWAHCHNADVFGVHAETLFIPDESFHFLYLIAHTAKHIINKGSGFRPFLDIALMLRHSAANMDWSWIRQELERLKLLDFTRTCFSLCEYWFQIEMPLERMTLTHAFLEKAEEKAFLDGVFGYQNSENAAARSAKEIKRSKMPRWITILQLTIKKLFPPYRDLQLVRRYSFIDGRPWLLPLTWVYRWIYCLVHKRDAGMDVLMEPIAKTEIIAAREEWLQQWGL